VRKTQKEGRMRRRQPKRIGVKIDMTPMVDVAFLLLIFFMCTTVFRKPQALEINLPPDPNAKVEIAESNVLTLRVIAPADTTAARFGLLGAREDALHRIEAGRPREDLRRGGEEEPEAGRSREDRPEYAVQVHGKHHRPAPVRGAEPVLPRAAHPAEEKEVEVL
jgi:hypothetical protein